MKKYIVALIIAIILVGVVTAFNNKLTVDNITGLLFSYKMLYISLLIIIVLFIISIIGFPSYFFYIIVDLFIFGQLIYLFFVTFSYKGILYLIVYFLFFKIPIIFFLILNTFYTLKYGKNLYRFIFNRFGKSIHNIKLYFKKIIIINTITYIYFTVSLIIGGKLMGLLAKYLFF